MRRFIYATQIGREESEMRRQLVRGYKMKKNPIIFWQFQPKME